MRTEDEGLRIKLPDGEYHVCRMVLGSGRAMAVVFPAALHADEAREVSDHLRELSGLANNWSKSR